jgi:hypothetical protein
MDQTQIDRHINILTEMTDYIEETISYAVITGISYEVNETMEEVICKLEFNRGTSKGDVEFNWCGTISGYSKKMPRMLLVDIHNAICGQYLKGIMDEAKNKNSITS